jgi:hypothetical protein
MNVQRHRGEDKWTMMHRAINKGCLDEIDELIDNGFNVNERFPLSGTYQCETAISCCAAYGTVKTMYHLISRGADYKVLSDLHGRKCNILEMAICVDNFLVAEQLYFSELEYYDYDNHCIRRMDLEPFEKTPGIIFRPMTEKYIKKAIDENVLSKNIICSKYICHVIKEGVHESTIENLIKINPRFICLELLVESDNDTIKMLFDMGLDIGHSLQTAKVDGNIGLLRKILQSGVKLKGSTIFTIDLSFPYTHKSIHSLNRFVDTLVDNDVRGFSKEYTGSLLGCAIAMSTWFSKKQLEHLIDNTNNFIFDYSLIISFQNAVGERIRCASKLKRDDQIRNVRVFDALYDIYITIRTLEQCCFRKQDNPIKIPYTKCFVNLPCDMYYAYSSLFVTVERLSSSDSPREYIEKADRIKFLLLAFGNRLIGENFDRTHDLKLTPSDYHRLPPSVIKVITAMTLLNKTEGNVVNLLSNELLFEIFSWFVPF